MIQFNLLPDIKIQYLKARRQKYLVLLTSVIVTLACVGVMVVLISISFGLQKKNISDLSRDIDTSSRQLENTQDLNKMLTVQNQLKALSGLHDGKAVASRLYGFTSQFTPATASISRLSTDFTAQSITISGTADSLGTVNTFTDTLKFATYHTSKAAKTERPAFSNVVLSSFGRDNKGATYTIMFKFDPLIFSGLDDVTLTVPNKVTTRSETEQPQALFKKAEAGQ